ncbi:Uncharacterized protein APZ42_021479 [Daphnia magna]|uniref:Uncharacterized protein n=1 Tax=Daphnia magna TaxID=35525 RepID=A0A164WMG7_9CRUS|nr:Uncharacterized protein APZ42_021479 [Daphnia magna]
MTGLSLFPLTLSRKKSQISLSQNKQNQVQTRTTFSNTRNTTHAHTNRRPGLGDD